MDLYKITKKKIVSDKDITALLSELISGKDNEYKKVLVNSFNEENHQRGERKITRSYQKELIKNILYRCLTKKGKERKYADLNKKNIEITKYATEVIIKKIKVKDSFFGRKEYKVIYIVKSKLGYYEFYYEQGGIRALR